MKRQQEITILLVSIAIISFAWVGFNLYHNAVTSTVSNPLSEDILGITPSFDTAALEKLKNRQYINPEYSFSVKQDAIATDSAGNNKTPLLQVSIPTVTIEKNQSVSSQSSQTKP